MPDYGELIWKELMRIANVLERLVPEDDPEQTPETPVCEHPPETRISFGTTNGVPDWQCRICRYRSLPP